MAKTMFRDVGGGRRRGNARFMASAWSVLLLVATLSGCDLTTPSSPNDASDLTGQTDNQTFVFTGTLSVSSLDSTLPADDTSTVLFIVEVKDSSGGPIQNLTTVGFSTDLGAFNIGGSLFSAAQVTTFNGSAEILFQSANRQAGTATVTAGLGTVSSSSSITLTPVTVEGTIALAFGTTGSTGLVTRSGVASTATPLDADIGVTALEFDETPIVGANVSFRIIQDTTTDETSNPSAEFLASRHTTTGPNGTAVNVLRVFGPGVVVVVADLFDPVTGDLISTSNRIILTTSTTFIISLEFADGSTTFTFPPGTLPGTVGINAMVANNVAVPQSGLTVRFSIIGDTTISGASLTSSIAVTNAGGLATTSVTVPDSGAAVSGSSVTILAELVNSAGATLATSNVVVAIGL